MEHDYTLLILNHLKEESGLSYQDIAILLGEKKTTVFEWMQKGSCLSMERLVRLLACFEFTLAALYLSITYIHEHQNLLYSEEWQRKRAISEAISFARNRSAIPNM